MLVMYPICEGTVDEPLADHLLVKLENLSVSLGDSEAQAIADTLAGADDEEAIIAGLLAKVTG